MYLRYRARNITPPEVLLSDTWVKVPDRYMSTPDRRSGESRTFKAPSSEYAADIPAGCVIVQMMQDHIWEGIKGCVSEQKDMTK